MDIVKKSVNKYSVLHNGESVGIVELSYNPYHKTNCYVRLELNCFDPQLSEELFVKLKEVAGCPLQIMADSDNVVLTTFLTAGGCVCKRKCYESEVGIEDYIGKIENTQLRRTTAGEPEYEKACRQIFEHYLYQKASNQRQMQELSEQMTRLEQTSQTTTEQGGAFIEKYREYTELETLTTEIANDVVKRVIVHKDSGIEIELALRDELENLLTCLETVNAAS